MCVSSPFIIVAFGSLCFPLVVVEALAPAVCWASCVSWLAYACNIALLS